MRWAALGWAMLENLFPRNLSLTDLARLQAADAGIRELLRESGAWSFCASAALPGIDIDPALLKASHRRQRLARHFPELLQAHFAEGPRVKILSPEDADRLAKLVKSARRVASVHAASGGGASCTVIGTIRFPRHALENVWTKQDPPNAVACSAPIALTVSSELMDALQSTSSRLEVQFGLSRCGLLVRLRDAAGTAGLVQDAEGGDSLAGEPSFRELGSGGPVVDLCVGDPAFTLHQRGGAAELDGSWKRMGPGVHLAARGKAAACEALEAGALCVVSVWDRPPCENGPAAALPSLALAMHLETVPPSSPW